jgi:hypothetical protein
MGEILLSEVGDRRLIRVANRSCSNAAWGQVVSLLIDSGATYDHGAMAIEVSQFRSSILPLVRIAEALHAKLTYDENVRRIFEVHLSELVDLGALRREGSRADVDDARDCLERIPRWTPPQPLTDRQFDNVARLAGMRHGANFSVPGAGKTRTALALYSLVRHLGTVDRLLVVGPKNAFATWEDEVRQCISGASCCRLVGGRRRVEEILSSVPEIALITYQMVSHCLDALTRWIRAGKAHVVLDESHRVKAGSSGVYANAVLQLSGLASRRDIMTGTPIPNSVADLDPQLKFLWPGQEVFSQTRHASQAEALRTVREATRNLYVRTTKDQLGLRPLSIIRTPVDMGRLQAEIYEALRNAFRQELGEVPRVDRKRFQAMGRQSIRLLQAATNPELLLAGETDFDADPVLIPKGSRLWDLCQNYDRYERPAKVWVAISRAEELARKDQKCLIWSCFVPNVEAIARRLRDLGAEFLHGQVPTSESGEPDTRESRIRRFHDDPDCWVMVANPAAAGEGISLHRVCHYAIYVDRTFNAAHYLQSLDRIHRLGLPPDATTTIEVLHALGTIDETVEGSLSRKTLAMAGILNDHGLARLAYFAEDVVEELPGGLDSDDVIAVIEHLGGQAHLPGRISPRGGSTRGART